MNRWGLRALSLVAVFMIVGCYHVTIETGRPPSTEVLHQPWAPSWIIGLIPPPTVQTMARCPNGVSKVETQMTFLNGLVHVLTLNIHTVGHQSDVRGCRG